MDLKLSAAGLLVGLLVGLTGMGGGSLLTPILVILFGFKPTVAVGTDILHGAVFKSFGAARHRTLGTVHARLTLWMLLGSAPMSLLGVAIGSLLERRYGGGLQSVEARVLGAALVLGGAAFFVRAFMRKAEASDAPFLLTRRHRALAFAIGFTGGFIVGLTSVGSGTFFGLAMLACFPLTARKIVGTDIFHAAALLWVAGFGHLVAGNVDFHAMAWLLVGSIPGVLISSHLGVRLPDRLLRLALGTVLGLSGVRLIGGPASGVLAVAVLIAGIGAIVLVARRDLAARSRTAPALAPRP